MTLKIVEYLATNCLSQLENDYSIQVKSFQEYPNLVCLNYQHIYSPLANPLVAECRALILDKSDSYRPVAYPFSRFPNVGEQGSSLRDLGDHSIYTKLDGSLVTLIYYQGEWIFSSRSIRGANGKLDSGETYKELIQSIWATKGYPYPEETTYCFTFELTSPFNRVVVPYQDSDLTLIAVRDMSSLIEECPNVYSSKYGWSCINTHVSIGTSISSIEGYVATGSTLVDHSFPRLKVKLDWYLVATKLKTNLNSENLLSLVLSDNLSELLAYFPEYSDKCIEISRSIDTLIHNIEQDYLLYHHIPVQKDFALAVQHLPYKSYLFTIRKLEPSLNTLQSTIRRLIFSIPSHKLIGFLNLQMEG